MYILPVDSLEEFLTVPFGTLFNNELITSDTTIFESFTNTSGCDSVLIRNFMLENPNAVSLIDQAHWDIFPNPTKEVLTIRTSQSLSEEAYFVRIHSILGEIVYEYKHDIVPSINVDLNLENLSAGTYLLTISSQHGMLTEKIVIHP